MRSRVGRLLLLVGAAACGESQKAVVAASVTVTPATATVITGESVLLIATVQDGAGNPLLDRPVTWESARPDLATVDARGLVIGVAPGAAPIRATREGKTGTALVTVRPVPVWSVNVTPSTSSLRIGGTLPLTADLRDQNGFQLTDRAVTWTSNVPDVASVSAQGVVTALSPGTATITAQSETRVGTATVLVLDPNARLTIDSVSPTPLVPGSRITITVRGAVLVNELRVAVGGVNTPVISAQGNDLRVVVPCVAGGPQDVRVSDGSGRDAVVTRVVTTPLRTLAVGQSFVATSRDEAACNALAPVAGNARYLVALFSAGTSANVSVDATLDGNAAGIAEAPPAMIVAPRSIGPARTEPSPDDGHLAVLERNRAVYASLRGRHNTTARALARVTRQAPTLGDMRSVYYTFSRGCNDTTEVIRARAIYVGTRSVVWEDSANGLLSTADSALARAYQRLGRIFDQEQYDVVKRAFGDPLRRDAETDADGVLHMVFSQRLNPTNAAAYVTACDQFPRTQSRGSNVGEYFYGFVPTASGSNPGSTAVPDGWFAFMSRTVVHEVKHIASMAARVANGAPSFEQSWLEEGTARHAEELWVRQSMHRVSWKANVGFGTATTNGVYCDFHLTDATCNASDTLRRPGYGMRRHFNEIRDKLVEPWNWSPYGTATGQAGSVFYQTTWSLVRYTIDRYGSSDEAFLGALTNARTNGTTNLAAVAGVSMDRLIGGWGLALAADDYPGMASPDPDVRFPSWNLRDIYAGLNASPAWTARWNTQYPIRPTPVAMGAFTLQQRGIRGGSHAYFELSGTGALQLLGLHGIGSIDAQPDLRIAVLRLP
ncbi:MAG: Ig domain-containing protein [Gemmatimonadaceae bacterium]|nr:Ig domain-containing protein [Gemmatimonadaceae bacterium]